MLPLKIVIVIVIRVIALFHLCPTIHGLSEFEKDCVKRLDHLSEIVSEEHIIRTCANRMKWLESVAEGEKHSFKPDQSRVTPAELEFLNSLDPRKTVGPLGLAQQQVNPKLTPGAGAQNLPIRPPGAYARKEYRMLTDDERHRFHNAVLVLKAMRVDELKNQYDVFVDIHTGPMAPGAHWGPCFYGWHREYLLRFERALRLVDPTVTLPYWDSTMDAILGDSAGDTMMWTPDFMGNKDGDVVTGPFAHWVMNYPTENRYRLFRGNGVGHRLMDDGDLDYLINGKDNFRNMTWHIDPYFETVHGENHFWIGGVMGDVGNSPADPSFYLHHSFVDLMWLEHQQRIYREFGRDAYVYPTNDDETVFGVGELHDPRFENSTIYNITDSYHLYDRPMLPFEGLRNQDGLSDIYQLYYYFDERPTCNATHDCGSPYLFCVTLEDSYKCAPTLKPGANCTDFEEFDCCWSGQCNGGVCEYDPPTPLLPSPLPSVTPTDPNSAFVTRPSFIMYAWSFLVLSVFSRYHPSH